MRCNIFAIVALVFVFGCADENVDTFKESSDIPWPTLNDDHFVEKETVSGQSIAAYEVANEAAIQDISVIAQVNLSNLLAENAVVNLDLNNAISKLLVSENYSWAIAMSSASAATLNNGDSQLSALTNTIISGSAAAVDLSSTHTDHSDAIDTSYVNSATTSNIAPPIENSIDPLIAADKVATTVQENKEAPSLPKVAPVTSPVSTSDSALANTASTQDAASATLQTASQRLNRLLSTNTSSKLSSPSPLIIVNELFKTRENVSIQNLDLLKNDVDISGGVLFIESFTQGTKGGLVEKNGSGLLQYTPPKNYSGKDWFEYVVSNGLGYSSTGRVNVTVVARVITVIDNIPVAQPDVVQIEQYSEIEIDVLANDTGLGDGVSLSGLRLPEHGSLSLINGKFIYTPTGAFFGQDSFDYQVSDKNGDTSISTVSINVKCIFTCTLNVKLALSWAPSPSNELIGYKLYVGDSPDNFYDVIDVGNVTEFDYKLSKKGDFYFAVSAINSMQIESELSTVVKISI